MSRGRTLWIAGLLLALLVAGVGSWYASSAPDGLEWSAEEAGFGNSAEDSVTAGSPLADYQVDGEEGRLSGGVAGATGVVAVLAVAGTLTWALRRRDSRAAVGG